MLGKFFKGLTRVVASAVTGVGTARALMVASQRLPEAQREQLERTNHRGETVSLISGPTLALSATTAAVLGAGDRRLAAAAAVAGLGSGAAGLYDDIVGGRPEQKADKGFRGHLRALREGRVSAGLVKIGAIGASGLLAGLALSRKPVDAVLSAGVIAGTANLVNLLDLRPGRAIKAGVLVGAPTLLGRSRGVTAGALGASVALLPEDLAERTMLGDAGANSLGALLGVSIAANTSRVGKALALATIIGLTAASEKVSFTKVIAGNRVLNAIDMWGRRPPEPVPTHVDETGKPAFDSVPASAFSS